jgi:hypothetical protein
MVKISHEVPLCLLEESKVFNNYDYCLPHLLDEYKEYKDYFLKAKEKGRYIIMDNSLHELGKSYDTSRLLYWINELKPNEFIVPDVWEDMEGSIKNAEEWKAIELPEGIEKMVVIQAKTIDEAFKCTKIYKKMGYKKLAYSYGASYYNDVCPHPNKDFGKALGRIFVITALYNQGVLTENDRIHLLGCAVPQEFSWYQKIPFIESIDTSNPIMSALEGVLYKDFGLDEKPLIDINASILKAKKSDFNLKILEHNVKNFKKFIVDSNTRI